MADIPTENDEDRDYTPRVLVPSKRAEELAIDVLNKRKETILKHLAEGWSIKHACEQAGVTPPVMRQYRAADPDFDELAGEAIEMGTDSLEDTALKRAKYGVDKPQFYQGEVCGHIREYSDTLLVFLLKARRPEKFTERLRNVLENADGTNVDFTFNTGGAAPDRILDARSREATEAEVVNITPTLP